MEQRLSLITLGVKDMARARSFYENGLGFKRHGFESDDVTFYQMDGFVLGLFGWDALAEDAGVPSAEASYRGVALAYNVRTKEAVAEALEEARQAGAKVTKEAQDVFWGGHNGYFSDLDGHLWEVAYNPFAPLDDKGRFVMKETVDA